jgi:hypothetical protein
MEANPYASFLADQDPLEVVENTAWRLSAVATKLVPASLEWRPAPGKWNAREILCHLADTEIAFSFRLRQVLAQDHHVIQPFDQERWAGMYGSLGVRAALNVFSSLREWNLALIGAAPPDAMGKPVTHPEQGELTFRGLIETMAGHDLNHLRQLDAIAAGFAGT